MSPSVHLRFHLLLQIRPLPSRLHTHRSTQTPADSVKMHIPQGKSPTSSMGTKFPHCLHPDILHDILYISSPCSLEDSVPSVQSLPAGSPSSMHVLQTHQYNQTRKKYNSVPLLSHFSIPYPSFVSSHYSPEAFFCTSDSYSVRKAKLRYSSIVIPVCFVISFFFCAEI